MLARISILLILSWAVAAAADDLPPVVEHEDGAEAHAGVDAVYTQFHRAYATLDADLAGDVYTEDALYLSPRRDIEHGRAAIRSGFAGMFERAGDRGEALDIRFRIVRRDVCEEVVSDVGYYTLRRTQSDGSVASDTGKFVVVARHEGEGRWRFQVDGYSSVGES